MLCCVERGKERKRRVCYEEEEEEEEKEEIRKGEKKTVECMFQSSHYKKRQAKKNTCLFGWSKNMCLSADNYT
jgi:hypothetical protein